MWGFGGSLNIFLSGCSMMEQEKTCRAVIKWNNATPWEGTSENNRVGVIYQVSEETPINKSLLK